MSNDWNIDIESRLAHQEDMMDQLNSALANQQLELEELRRTCKLLLKKLTELEDSQQHATEAKQEIPPHY